MVAKQTRGTKERPERPASGPGASLNARLHLKKSPKESLLSKEQQHAKARLEKHKLRKKAAEEGPEENRAIPEFPEDSGEEDCEILREEVDAFDNLDRPAQRERSPSPIYVPPNQLGLIDRSPAKEALTQESPSIPPRSHLIMNSTGREEAAVGHPEMNTLNEAALTRILDAKLKGTAQREDLDRIFNKLDENAAETTRLQFRLNEVETRINDNVLRDKSTIKEIVKECLQERESALTVGQMDRVESCSSGDDFSVNSARRSFRNLATNSEQEAGRERQYYIARRSLRVWPIPGNNTEEIKNALGDFLRNAMMVEDGIINGIKSVKRIAPTQAALRRNNGPHLEVCVEFSCIEDRDYVAGKTFRLAKYVGVDRRPTAAIRLEIPPYLMSRFRLLMDLGYELRREHGPDTKKHIKFDDFSHDLVLEIKLGGSFSWMRIDAGMASDLKRNRDREKLSELRKDGSDANFETSRSSRDTANYTPLGRQRWRDTGRRDPWVQPTAGDSNENNAARLLPVSSNGARSKDSCVYLGGAMNGNVNKNTPSTLAPINADAPFRRSATPPPCSSCNTRVERHHLGGCPNGSGWNSERSGREHASRPGLP